MTWVDRRPAPGRLELIRAFVNTLDCARGPELLKRPEQARDWLVKHGLADTDLRLNANDFRRVLSLREAFRSLLLANAGAAHDPDATATLNEVARRAALAPRIAEEGTAQLVIAAEGLDKALGELAAVMFDAMAANSWTRLRACPSCKWGFYDHSRNQSSRWCDMNVCGNRAKQRALNERRRQNRR